MRVVSICKLPTRMLWLCKQHSWTSIHYMLFSGSKKWLNILLTTLYDGSSMYMSFVCCLQFLYYALTWNACISVCMCDSVWVLRATTNWFTIAPCKFVHKLPCQIYVYTYCCVFVYVYLVFSSSSFRNSSNECQNV